MTFQEVLERTAWRVGSKTSLYCDDEEITYEARGPFFLNVSRAWAGVR